MEGNGHDESDNEGGGEVQQVHFKLVILHEIVTLVQLSELIIARKRGKEEMKSCLLRKLLPRYLVPLSLYFNLMARRCQLTGKGPQTGNNRSHSMRATKRRFLPNIITKRILDPITGKYKKVKIAASTLRTLKKQGPQAVKLAKELLKG